MFEHKVHDSAPWPWMLHHQAVKAIIKIYSHQCICGSKSWLLLFSAVNVVNYDDIYYDDSEWWWHWQPREHICPGWPMDKLSKDDHLVSLVTIGDLIIIDNGIDYHSVMMIQLVMMRNQIRCVAKDKDKWWW